MFSSIYPPSVIAIGLAGYLSFLYLSATIDRARQITQNKMNRINLAHKIPNIQGIDLANQNKKQNMQKFYNRIDEFVEVIQQLTTHKTQKTQNLHDQSRLFRQVKKQKPQKNKDNLNSSMKLDNSMEHTKTYYYHSNKLIFEDIYLYGFLVINKPLNFQQYCIQLAPSVISDREQCLKKTSESEEMIRQLLYRNNLGNEVESSL